MTRIYKRDIRYCKECGNTFSVFPSSLTKYCSKVCGSKHRGGYRSNSGSSRTGYYKGIFCGSTWELCWVIYSIDHGIKFTRFSGLLENNGVKYYPDFILDDNITIVEIKGPRPQQVETDLKTQVAESYGYKVNVLKAPELEHIFEYVTTKYSTKKFYELYDGYKPAYTYSCTLCNISFSKDKLLKTTEKFCNRICAGKFRNINKKSKTDSISDTSIISYKRKFTKDEALAIFADTRSTQPIANEYNTTKNAIWFIKTKKSYKWIHSR